jgi:hypothetical protein
MLAFLKSLKFVSELNKGVQSMKHFVYPSILQRQAMPAIKTSQTKNIVINYQELSGIKLTYLLPCLNNMIREAILNSVSEEKDKKPFCMVILCHSFIRCQEMADTISELITFCDDMLEVINLDSTDFTESQIKIKKSM